MLFEIVELKSARKLYREFRIMRENTSNEVVKKRIIVEVVIG